MSGVYKLAAVPYPNLDINVVDQVGLWFTVTEAAGSQGPVHVVRDCGDPSFKGQWLTRRIGGWGHVSPGDESDNGIWFQMNGSLAAYNPEPGGVVEFRRAQIPNA